MAKIVAIIVTDPRKASGGVPVFLAEDAQKQQELAFTLERIMDCMVHDLKNGTIILVDHSGSPL